MGLSDKAAVIDLLVQIGDLGVDAESIGKLGRPRIETLFLFKPLAAHIFVV